MGVQNTDLNSFYDTSEVDQFIVERLVEVGGALEGITSTFALDKNIVCVHTTSPCTLLSLATYRHERVYPHTIAVPI
jgi:hypothetical protein